MAGLRLPSDLLVCELVVVFINFFGFRPKRRFCRNICREDQRGSDPQKQTTPSALNHDCLIKQSHHE